MDGRRRHGGTSRPRPSSPCSRWMRRPSHPNRSKSGGGGRLGRPSTVTPPIFDRFAQDEPRRLRARPAPASKPAVRQRPRPQALSPSEQGDLFLDRGRGGKRSGAGRPKKRWSGCFDSAAGGAERPHAGACDARGAGIVVAQTGSVSRHPCRHSGGAKAFWVSRGALLGAARPCAPDRGGARCAVVCARDASDDDSIRAGLSGGENQTFERACASLRSCSYIRGVPRYMLRGADPQGATRPGSPEDRRTLAVRCGASCPRSPSRPPRRARSVHGSPRRSSDVHDEPPVL